MKKYTKQYRTEETRGEKNKKKRAVIYTGDYYEIKNETGKREWFLCSAAAFFALHAAAGFLNTASSRIFYVTLPYAILFFPGLYFIMGAFRFCHAGEKMELPAYEKSIVRMRRSVRGLLFGLGYLIAAELFFQGNGLYRQELTKQELLWEIVFLIICAVNMAQIFENKKRMDRIETTVLGPSQT